VKTVVIMFPGASLMRITPLDDGLHVSCPGCRREQTYHGERAAEFVHDAGCPVEELVRHASDRVRRSVNY